MSNENQKPPAGDPPAPPAPEAKASKAQEAKRSTFHVVGPGSVMFKGKTHGPNAELKLTDEEALDLGAAVAEGKAPPAPEAVEKRSAGRYRVAGPGSVWHDGRQREKGYELTLDAPEARSLGAAIEPVV